ncbi:MAG: PilT protein [uncultured bacterium]|nr:MAG: PilT protein [uncultured bacterium]
MKVFVDTSALFATLVRNDYMHVRASETFKRLIEGTVELHTTSYVVLETIALLQARVGLDAARSFQHEFLSTVKVCWVDQSLHEKAFRRLELRASREISLVDCASFVWMEESGVECAFAYDEHFSAEGFTVFAVPDDVNN